MVHRPARPRRGGDHRHRRRRCLSRRRRAHMHPWRARSSTTAARRNRRRRPRRTVRLHLDRRDLRTCRKVQRHIELVREDLVDLLPRSPYLDMPHRLKLGPRRTAHPHSATDLHNRAELDPGPARIGASTLRIVVRHRVQILVSVVIRLRIARRAQAHPV